MKFNPFKKLITGAAILASTTGDAKAGEVPQVLTNDQSTTNVVAKNNQVENYSEAEVVNFAEAQQKEILLKKLTEEKEILEGTVTDIKQQIKGLQNNFESTYHKALNFTGTPIKPRYENMEDELLKLVLTMAREQVGKKDITSEESVQQLLNIALDQEGPLDKYVSQMNELLPQQLGSTVMMRSETPGKLTSEDIQIHQRLGTLPRLIVEKGLALVQEEHRLNSISEEIAQLAQTNSGIASN